jgi:cytochrome c oxidase cbb3-type subunit 3
MKKIDEPREHSFDGITEYDNDLPRWWLILFWITVGIACIYPFIYDFGPGEFASESIDRDVAALKQLQSAGSAPSGSIASDESLLKLTRESAAVATGAQVFATRCMPCHGDKGQGVIGPNLTDDFWLHGGSIGDIRRIITDGVLEKGMIAWKGQLTPEQIDAVSAFVWTLHGTTPPNPKAPQGDEFKRESP